MLFEYTSCACFVAAKNAALAAVGPDRILAKFDSPFGRLGVCCTDSTAVDPDSYFIPSRFEKKFNVN